ncbi:MAG: trigger factor [Piscirickettsiaceae bacterium CG_4_9_14_3_um_filter_43_564]|nr:trigger factor [Thiomicrospira sp.]OIP94329.1 MAG: trigger factor [Thiomicrospira sp. CG2_30_44_34]PIQ02573.1 MAG: trigger factor [Piscirickettsiaceae bacterium CG18_big_fil_WC_8_21_14_2_50_44_103]PIU39560.1 MAG: trigger factor [Piscirickettsiaceae bacterium CG07_land_8_20_14_0_80_44_28]PIW57571.1 MAG: trigger factor [Piscirickettsiaceae bacterium CG12_big_fil_rev_8_21_14_0_65_44_934]PIW77855.1 MAG: trigger factor [Piscirickettsiaceae bacterium CG_4_8_14_3_um_filter_44_38]PIX80718.1 MAG: t
MQVTVEKPESGLEHTINVTLPSTDLDSKVEKRLAQMRSTVKMDGFRPGKVPLSIVKKRYGGQVRQEMLGETVQESFYNAINQQDLNVAGYPQFHKLDEQDGQILYSAKFEVFPEIKLPKFDTLSIEVNQSEVTDADVEMMVTKLREQKSAWKSANGNKKAKAGDQVIIDFVGKKDGVEFEGGKAEDVPLELGSGRMIPGFEEGIEGMKKGEEKTIEVTFPEDYQSEDLKGQTVTFDITVHSVQSKVLPEIDEEFVKSLGVEAGTEEALIEEVTANMKKELARAVENKNRSLVLDALSEAVEVDLPQSLVQQEAQTLLNRQAEQFKQQGLKPEDLGMNADMFKEEAEKRVKIGLVLGEVIKQNNIEATDEGRKAFIEEQASSYDDPQEVINWYANNPDAQKEIDAILIEREITKSILAEANVKEVSKKFEEIVNTAA